MKGVYLGPSNTIISCHDNLQMCWSWLEARSPWSLWPCDLTLCSSPVRSGPGKEAARPADRYSTCRITSLPSGSGSALGTAITLPASQIFVLWAINLYGCKDYSPTSDNNCLGSPLHNYFLAVFWTRCLQPFWKLKQNCYLTAITLVATSYWNVVTNNWVSCDPSRG